MRQQGRVEVNIENNSTIKLRLTCESKHRRVVIECELGSALFVLSEVMKTDWIITGKFKTCKSEG